MGKGNRIVFEGLGNEQAGIINSDLIFEIDEVADPVWKRKGNDLVYYVDITLLNALESKPFSIVMVGII